VEIQELHGVAKQHNALLVLHGASGIDEELIKVMLSPHCLLCNHKKKVPKTDKYPQQRTSMDFMDMSLWGRKDVDERFLFFMDYKVPKCVLCGRNMSIIFMDSKAQSCVLFGRKSSSIYSQDSKAQKCVF
jgi:hypothetical protein